MKPSKLKQRIQFWQKKRQKAENEVKQLEKIVKDLQNLCNHKYDDGTTAIEDSHFASPYAQPVCKICGNIFE